MKKLIFILFAFIIQYSYAQTPNDNRGSGNCLLFDGNSDYVDFPSPTSNWLAQLIRPTVNSPFTISTWINYNRVDVNFDGGIIRSLGATNGLTGDILLHISGSPVPGVVRFYKWDNDGLDANGRHDWDDQTYITPNEWHNLLIRCDGTNVELWVDGENMGTRTSQDNTSHSWGAGTFFATLTASATVDHHFSGSMDEVRVWNRALTQNEIRDNLCNQLVGNEAGLVGYWNMNEGTDNTCSPTEDVCDLTVNGNNGTLQ